MSKNYDKLVELYSQKGYDEKEARSNAERLMKLQRIKAEDSKYRTPVVLTRCNKSTIKLAIERLPEDKRLNVSDILFEVTEIFEERYGEGDNGTRDYQLERSGMKTTTQIKEKIEVYLRKYAKKMV